MTKWDTRFCCDTQSKHTDSVSILIYPAGNLITGSFDDGCPSTSPHTRRSLNLILIAPFSLFFILLLLWDTRFCQDNFVANPDTRFWSHVNHVNTGYSYWFRVTRFCHKTDTTLKVPTMQITNFAQILRYEVLTRQRRSISRNLVLVGT